MPTRDEAVNRWPIQTRLEAHAKGAQRYFTGKPCKHGHWDQRSVAYGVCLSCNREYATKFRSIIKGGNVIVPLSVHPGDVADLKAFAAMLQASRDAVPAPPFVAPVVPGTPANWNPPAFTPRTPPKAPT